MQAVALYLPSLIPVSVSIFIVTLYLMSVFSFLNSCMALALCTCLKLVISGLCHFSYCVCRLNNIFFLTTTSHKCKEAGILFTVGEVESGAIFLEGKLKIPITVNIVSFTVKNYDWLLTNYIFITP